MWVSSQVNRVSILFIMPHSEVIQCSQDQWDIYKLDPLYSCLVRSHPHPAQITRVTNIKTVPQNPQRKRRASTPSSERSASTPPRKKLRNDLDEDVEDDVSGENMGTPDEMIVDPQPYLKETGGFQSTSMPEGHCAENQSFERIANLGQASKVETSESLPVDAKDTKKRKRMLIHKA